MSVANAAPSPRAAVKVIDASLPAAAALTGLRGRILRALREPASAAELASRLGLSRQLINYHMRILEESGLTELVEERRRRGFVERRMRASAETFLLDPELLSDGGLEDPETGGESTRAAHDRWAADRLLQQGARLVREVARMKAAADDHGTRLLTFTIETELRVESPAALEALCGDLEEAIGQIARRHHTPAGRGFTILTAAHPTPGISGANPGHKIDGTEITTTI